MKKLISLILALALCLTAFSAFADTASKEAAKALSVPAPTVVTSDLKDAAGKQIVTIEEYAEDEDASIELLDAIISGDSGVTLAETYKNLEGLEEAQSVLCTPMSKIIVEADAVTEANKDEFVTLTSIVDAAASEYLKSFGEDLVAVFTYLKGDAVYSIPVKCLVLDNVIQYEIPLEVLADASGCPAFINFVI